jgi:Protein of unknown function (DUF3833)
MTKNHKTLGGIIVASCMLFSGCVSPDLGSYSATQPEMSAREFFNGPIKAWGIVQDWRGRVTTRFDADLLGTWDGNIGTLEEDFRFYDGKQQRRVWTLHERDDGRITGTAGDILGEASGQSSGSALNLKYQMDLQIEDKTYRVKFDDWMWLMKDGVVINRAYIKKFGLTVGQLTVFMQKQPVIE